MLRSLSSSRCINLRKFSSSAVAASSAATSASSSSLSTSPLRLCVLGGGLSGLSLAHQLQRQLRFAGRENVEITVLEKQERIGGWIRTQQSPTAPSSLTSSSSRYLLERGPRSFMYRDSTSEYTIDLLNQLQLGDSVILADASAAKRYVWQGGASGGIVQMPRGFRTLWAFPQRNELIRGIMHEWSTPASTSKQDESITDFITRRFNSTIVDELIDPMIAGIYAGNPSRLSVHSCFKILPTMEQRSGGILRDTFAQPESVKAEKKAQLSRQFDDIDRRRAKETGMIDDPKWMHAIRKAGSYTLKGGVSTLTNALTQRLTGPDVYAGLMDAPSKVRILKNAPATGLRVNEKNKPVVRHEGEEREYDHVFSTLPSDALHALLSSSHTSLPLPSHHHSLLLSHLSPSTSMPLTSVWVVNIMFAGEVLKKELQGFGLLIPSKHTIKGAEILGISYDSCIFPQLFTEPALVSTTATNNDKSISSSPPTSVTSLTVMLGGDRHPQFSTMSAAEVSAHALRSVQTLLGIDVTSAHKPFYVDAMLNENCIPQYRLGHAEKTSDIIQIMQHLAYMPTSHQLPIGIEYRKVEGVEKHAPTSDVATATPHQRPLTLLGSAFCGVSLNDCVYHAAQAATDFVRREIPKKDAK